MSKMLVHHKVKDFNAWKAVYDSNADVRAASGELSDKIYRDESDPNSLTILFGWELVRKRPEIRSIPRAESHNGKGRRAWASRCPFSNRGLVSPGI